MKPGQICEFWSLLTKTKWERPLPLESRAGFCHAHFDFGTHNLRAAGSMVKREGVVGQNQNAPSITDTALQFWNVPLNSEKVTLPNKTTRFEGALHQNIFTPLWQCMWHALFAKKERPK